MALDTAKHKNILIKILKDLYTDTGIGPILGFKGGTAAYLYHGLSRESLDLDFDLLDETKEDQVFEKIEAVAKNYGKIKEHRKKRYNLFLLLSYENEAPNIKVEINRREFGSKYEIKSYLGISMKIMIREDMFAHKLVAMYERMGAANRDIYDVWFFLNNDWPINKEIVEKRTEMSFRDFLQKCIEALEKLPDRGILAGMGELLDAKQKAWAKVSLRKDTIFLLKAAALDRYSEVFTVGSSRNLKYTKAPGHTYSGADKLITSYSDVKDAPIQEIKRQDDKTLVVKVISDTTGHVVNCYIRSLNDEGVKELNIVTNAIAEFNGQTYDAFLNHKFKK